MAGDDEKLFLFVSHASKDKQSPRFLALLERLHAAGIPLGIDRPRRLMKRSPDTSPMKFVWSLDGRNEDWQQHVIRVMAEGACGIVVVASSNTKKNSYVWQEFLIATTLKITLNPNFGFFLFALEPNAHAFAPEAVRSSTFMDASDELDGEIERMRAHLDAERRRRADRAPERHLVDIAMKAMIRDMSVLHFFGGTRVQLDAIFTPLRGDTLTSAERQAAHEEMLDPRREGIDLQGPDTREDRLTRLDAVRAAAKILQNPIMPGMPLGLAAAQDPLAVAGGTTKLSELVEKHGHVIVLGEPAAGKTTLLKWLALRFAEVWAATQGTDRPDITVQALRWQVDPIATQSDEAEEAAATHVSLGPARLPVFLSIPDLSANIRLHGASDLIPFLAMQLARRVDPIAFKNRDDLAHGVIVDTLNRGRLLVLLDGLDEIVESDRKDTIRLIEQFAETWTSTGPASEPRRDNRLIVTSRIVGYHAQPLSSEWPHVVVDRMTPAVVRDFWKRLYRSGAFGEIEAPAARAEALHHNVYARHRSGVADLAGIPLLAILLARVFQENRQFPEHRAQIYDRALISILKKEERETELPADFVAQWLAPLAYDLQAANGPALIGQTLLDHKMRERLRTIRPELGSDLERAKFVKYFLDENKKKHGLLVERSPDVWAFVHRTFQEYFAGLWLDDVVKRGAFTPAQLTDPRWREPLLLLLGSSIYSGDANTTARDTVFETLLGASAEPASLARVGRLLAEALAEMPDLPSDRVLGLVVRAVLADLAEGNWHSTPAYARARAVAALYAFGRRDAARLEAALISVLQDGPGEVSRVVARIVLDRHWCTFGIETALRHAANHDSASELFPILQALQQVASETHYGELGARGKSMAFERQFEAHRKAASDRLGHLTSAPGNDETVYQVVRRRAERGRYAFISRFNLFDETVDTHLKRGSGARTVATTIASSGHVPIDLAASGGMRAVFDATLGRAFEYRGRATTLLEYRRFVHFAGLNDPARHTILEYNPEFRMMFGSEDPVYYLAVNLDLFFEPIFKDIAPPYLTAPDVDLPAKLEPYVARILRPSRGWFDALRIRPWRFLVRRRMSPANYARAVLCDALADPSGTKRARDLIGNASEDRRRALDHLLRTTLASARDTVMHAGQHLAAHLHEIAAVDELAAIQTLDTTCRLVPGTPLRVSESVDVAHPRAFAERLAYRLLGLEENDRRYAAAAALDLQTGLATATLLPILQALCESATMGWAEAQLGISIGAPWPIDRAGNEITLAVLDMATGIDAGDDMSLRSAQAGTLFDRLHSQSRLQAASLAPFATLPRGVLNWPMRNEDAAAIVEDAADPYHRARFALGLFESMQANDGVERATALLPAIDNPVLRLDIAERLAKLVQETEASRFRAAAVQAARAITDPAQRWRALLRLSWQPGYPEQALLRETAAAVDAIGDPAQLRADAASITRLVSRRTAGARAALSPLFNRAIPIGLRNARLASCFTATMEGHGDAAAILYIAQTCADLLDACVTNGFDGAAQVDNGDLPRPTNTVDLTVELAEQIYRVASGENTGSSSPLPSVARAKRLRLRTGFSIYACERWLDRPEHPLAWIAALAIVKTRSRRDRRVLEPLLHALRGDDEGMAAQAAWMLSRGRFLVERDPPDADFDDMGLETLLWIGRRGADPGDRDLRSILVCLVADTAFRGPEPIDQLFDHMDRTPEDGEAVTFLLECLTWTDAAATKALMRHMCSRAPAVQAVVLRSLAAVDMSQRVQEKPSDPPAQGKATVRFIHPIAAERLADAIRDLEAANDSAPFRIFPDGGASLCALIESTCASEPHSEHRVRAFMNALENARIDIRHVIANPDSAYEGLERFLKARSQQAGQALPFRHDRDGCDKLRNRVGADAVHVAAELLIELAVSADADFELTGLVATMCFEFALKTPSLVASALKSRLGGEARLMTFLARLVHAPPRGISITTAIALACLLRPLDQACVEALIAVSRHPDFGDWVLLEQSLIGVGRVEPATLPLIQAASTSQRPRTVLLAIRLLGILARDANADGDTRRTARLVLEHLASSPEATQAIHIHAPATRTKDEGCILTCGTLADIAATELFFADGAPS